MHKPRLASEKNVSRGFAVYEVYKVYDFTHNGAGEKSIDLIDRESG